MKKNTSWKNSRWYFGALIVALSFVSVVLLSTNSYSQTGGDKRVVRTVTTVTEYGVPRSGCTTTTTTAQVDCPDGDTDCTPVPATKGDPVVDCP